MAMEITDGAAHAGLESAIEAVSGAGGPAVDVTTTETPPVSVPVTTGPPANTPPVDAPPFPVPPFELPDAAPDRLPGGRP
jgi:hypothetical protein